MKAYYAVLLLIGVLGSCNPISHNERLSIQGKVSDPSGNPVPEIEIRTVSSYYLLGNDFSDIIGNFDFVSLNPNKSDFKIHINTKSSSDSTAYQADYGSIFYHFDSREMNNALKLDTIKLPQTAQLNFEISSSPTDTINFAVRYRNPELHYYVNSENLLSNFIYSAQNILPGMPNFSHTYNTLQNSEAILIYSINDGEEQEISIPINQPEITYVLSY